MRQMNNTAMTKSLLAATLLALATHLLSTTLAKGDDTESQVVMVKLRAQASVEQGRVKLGDVCSIEGLPAEYTERTIAIHDQTVSMSDILRYLTEAGVREDRLHVRGPINCNITFILPATTDEDVEEASEWSNVLRSKQSTVAAARPPLEKLLSADLATRLGLTEDAISLTFRGRDNELAKRTNLGLIGSQRADDLGSVSWHVQVDGSDEIIRGDAEATVARPTVVRPIARGQTIRLEDIELQTARIDRISERGISLDQAVGQRASRDLNIGTPLDADQIQPTLLVKRGQRLTVVTNDNGISISLIAQSQGDATYGQSVRARVEATGETISVRVVGPQLGSIDR